MHLSLQDIQIRDPFILPVPEEAVYYLFGSTDADIWNPPATGFDCYRSPDLTTWSGPYPAFRPPAGFWSDRNFWAPEVHRYRGRYFMFATFKADGISRGTQALVADAPAGPYRPHSDGPLTPPEWECLDGTLHVDENRQPWLVFCHEWVQIGDGTICALRLSEDLTAGIGEPVELFAASDAPWVDAVDPRGRGPAYVTDGPFLHRASHGSLLMLWASFADGRYAQGVAVSDSGDVLGPWRHVEEPLFASDGGHGMVFRDFDGALHLAVHTPNRTPHERAILVPLAETETGTIRPAVLPEEVQ